MEWKKFVIEAFFALKLTINKNYLKYKNKYNLICMLKSPVFRQLQTKKKDFFYILKVELALESFFFSADNTERLLSGPHRTSGFQIKTLQICFKILILTIVILFAKCEQVDCNYSKESTFYALV